MQYKNFVLDQFQVDSINSIERGNSVVVSAATGTGKTLIADYIIDKFLKLGKKIIYTAPIKALSNQKFKNFSKDFGESKVGILTGDVSINSRAPLLIMTTEIYRNMLFARDPELKEVSYVVFDEIHYISDIERGTVWEESIIFSPDHIRFLCLSATIPNAREFADWIQLIKKHTVDVVEYHQRAVPLKHFVYDKLLGVTSAQELQENLKIKDEEYFRFGKKKQKKEPLDPKMHLDLIKDIKGKLPTIFFVFNRKDCEKKASELSKRFNFTTQEQKSAIIHVVRQKIPKEYVNLESVRRMREIIPSGIAYHHAGMLPMLKDIVEELFEKGLISVLYATETFAVGINMPAKSVCFNSLEKYDGYNFRYLFSKEYFQLAGRAGRRGIDKEGFAYAIVDRNFDDFAKILKLTSQDIEPIISRFELTYNTVLHLVHAHKEEEIKQILRSNFDYFLKKRKGEDIRIMVRFYNKVDILKKRGYVDKNNLLTEKGLFTLHIFFYELIIGEIFCTKIYKDLRDDELLVLVAALVYEERLRDYFSIKGTKQTYINIIKQISKNEYLEKKINKRSIQRMILLVSRWANGYSFKEILEVTNLQEGDIIRLFRRIIDVLRQVRKATHDETLKERINFNIHKIDRDIVQVALSG